jgi:sensor histidine kinase YesM
MKIWLDTIYRNRYFVLFVMLFAYVQSIHNRVSHGQEINAYTFTPEAPLFSLFEVGILFLITNFFIKKWQKTDVFSSSEMLKIFGLSLITFPVIMQVIGFVIALIFNNVEKNFNLKTFTYTIFNHFLDGFIYGSFLLVYHYHKKNKNHQEQLASYHKALSESKIYQLKNQLNPHFLFNNLNVLDQLIEEDKHKASDFLNEFSEIYRYVLQATDKELVSVQEELIFAKQFFNLIQHKYGKSYQLIIGNTHNQGFIVPLTLQLLIENAVQHNLGTEKKPVFISLNIANEISVTNTCVPKSQQKSSSGRALNNLKEQYKLLTDKQIQIEQSNTIFEVIVPIIERQKL